MARTTPYVYNTLLTFNKGSQVSSIPVETEEWQQWLNKNDNTTFRFTSEHGSFTARHEYKKGGSYWYAYRKQQRKLHKAYLGKSTELTVSHMNAIARYLSLQIAHAAISPEATEDIIIQSDSSSPYTTTDLASFGEDHTFLTTKLLPPPCRIDLVARPKLLEKLESCSRYKLTLLTAPAGFGKTTLLSAWHTYSEHPQAWLSLDSSDNTPAHFWHYTLAALQKQHAIDEQGFAAFQSSSLSDPESFLTPLINALATISQTTILIFDDFHVIHNQAIYDALAFLLDHLPAHIHLVIASRGNSLLPLIRLRIQGQLLELDSNDQRFNLDETTIFLQQIMGLDISQQEISQLHSQTEGWIAGLQLAALSMQRSPHIEKVLTSFKGNHQYIVDYLTSEVLRQLPTHLHDFLLNTSLLERLSASLCQAVTGRSDSQEILEHLEHANLFLIPLDEQRQWYRYHHLFAEFLQARLQQTQPELMPLLHRRAAEWYKQHGLISATIQHAFATRDDMYTARLLEEFAPIMIIRSEIMTLIQWLYMLSEQVLHLHPHLHLTLVACLISIGQLKEAEIHLHTIKAFLERLNKQQDEETTDTRRIKCEFFAASAALAAFKGEAASTLEYTQAAFKFLSKDDIFTRSILVTSQGCAYLINGEFHKASEAFTEAANVYQAQGHNYITLTSIACQGYLQMAHGHLCQAIETLQQAIQLGIRPGGQMFAAVSIAYVLLGEIFYEHNKLDEAEHYAQDGINIGKRWGYIGIAGWGYRTLALVQLARGDSTGAMALIEQVERETRAYSLPVVTKLVALTQASIELRTGNLQAAMQWTQSCERPIENVLIFPHELEYIARTEIYLAQGQYAEASNILAQLRPIAEEAQHIYTILQCLTLQALVFYSQGHLHEATHTLSQALSLSGTEGYIRIFVDRGKPIATLLQHLVAQGNRTPYIFNLLAALGITKQKLQSKLNSLLSEREQFVLRAIATGKSNQEIAHDSVVAVSTIKTHINNIYIKLDVRNRTQALARAHDLGLL